MAINPLSKQRYRTKKSTQISDTMLHNDTGDELTYMLSRLNGGHGTIQKTCKCFHCCGQRPTTQFNCGVTPKTSMERKHVEECYEYWRQALMMEDDDHAAIFCMCPGRNKQTVLQNEVVFSDRSINEDDSLAENNYHDENDANTENTESTRKADDEKQDMGGEVKLRPVDSKNIAGGGMKSLVAGKRRKRQKKKCHCDRIRRPVESNTDVLIQNKAFELGQALYPGVNCGHKNCIPEHVVTPKTMGWLWSLKETGGVKVISNNQYTN